MVELPTPVGGPASTRETIELPRARARVVIQAIEATGNLATPVTLPTPRPPRAKPRACPQPKRGSHAKRPARCRKPSAGRRHRHPAELETDAVALPPIR
ncbi:MAG: hypothetical protein DLM63_02440 [Solirubrobacterales bacterium]|nr:MAG: hypothetical protein DLM63_02440 [Solirubrobacterales bacterium]